MKIHKTASLMWGTMASGVMFVNNGKMLLQLRGAVEDSGTWGVPGGALDGEFFFSKDMSHEEKIAVILEHRNVSGRLMNHYDVNPDDLEKFLRENPNIIDKSYQSVKEKPILNENSIQTLWVSALKEVEEEIGGVPYGVEDQYESSKRYVKWENNIPYVTFIVNLDDDQKEDLNQIIEGGTTPEFATESHGHEWHDQDYAPETLHPGVRHVLDRMNEKVDATAATVVINKIVADDSSWTQGQVYSDGNYVYDMEILNRIVDGNAVRRIKIKELSDQLYDGDAWAVGERPISPMSVMSSPSFDEIYFDHMKKIRTSDLSNPI